MTKRYILYLVGILVLVVGRALAEDATPVPTPVPIRADDPRPGVCAAPYQAGWQAHVVQAGDTLPTLMAGMQELTVTQAAALNCVDDPTALAVGSVVWLPPVVVAEATPICQPLAVGLDCRMQAHGIVGADQYFQHGKMIWRGDTKEILVIVSGTDGVDRLYTYNDTYVDGEADPSEVAPDGLIVPHRGFGKLWTQLGGSASALGWAVAPEGAINLTVQEAGRVSYTTYFQFADGTVYAATILPRMVEGWWVKVSA